MKNVENLVRTLSETEEVNSFKERNDSSLEKLESRNSKPSRHPVSVASHRRTSPNGDYQGLFLDSKSSLDIVGFSAVRASGFSREGNSRIYFENTVKEI